MPEMAMASDTVGMRVNSRSTGISCTGLITGAAPAAEGAQREEEGPDRAEPPDDVQRAPLVTLQGERHPGLDGRHRHRMRTPGDDVRHLPVLPCRMFTQFAHSHGSQGIAAGAA